MLGGAGGGPGGVRQGGVMPFLRQRGLRVGKGDGDGGGEGRGVEV